MGKEECAVEKLLKSVSELESLETLIESTSSSFNVFRLCRVDHYEIAHSRIIAELLRPDGMHGMGCEPLRLFLTQEGVSEYVSQRGIPTAEDLSDLTQAVVTTEEVVAEGCLDIAIHWRGKCIVIENKVYAGDQDRQLERYEESVLKMGENPVIFYLTLDGRFASEDSAGHVDYFRLSYVNHIIKWLEDCTKVMTNQDVCMAFKQYKKLVEELTEEWRVRNEIVDEMMVDSSTFIAACCVGKCVAEARLKTARKIMEDLKCRLDSEIYRERFAEWSLKDSLYELFVKNERFRGFGLERSVDDKCYDLCCEFQERGEMKNLFIGFCRTCRKTKMSEDEIGKKSNTFLSVAKNCDFFGKKEYDVYKPYPKEQTKWIYGFYPNDPELRFWGDSFLAKRLDDKTLCDGVIEKLVKCLAEMLSEAEQVEKVMTGAKTSR